MTGWVLPDYYVSVMPFVLELSEGMHPCNLYTSNNTIGPVNGPPLCNMMTDIKYECISYDELCYGN
jgi:hypothetical protein